MWMGHISIGIINMTWKLTVNRILNASKLKKNNLDTSSPYTFALIGVRSDDGAESHVITQEISTFVILKATSIDRQTRRLHIFKIFAFIWHQIIH